MAWLAGSLVVTMVTWTLLATLVSSLPAAEPRSQRVQRSAADDDDGLRGELADLSSTRFDTQKRPWGRNNVAVWGKRFTADLNAEAPGVDKRKWGQKNMALWGKRFVSNNDAEQWDDYPLTKRRWGQKHMAIWGKRADADMLKYDIDQLEAQKRKWGQQNMALWG